MCSSLERYAPSFKLPRLEGRSIDNGRLVLKTIIGQGGCGIVYLATELESQEMFAVKCINNPVRIDKERTEAAMHAHCSRASEGVLKLHNVTIVNDLLFMVTDYCEGGDLLEYIQTHEFFGRDDYIKSTILQILDAVEACHNIPIFHRDLKPENILVKDNGTKIVISDFGFATKDPRSRDFKIGTDAFMAPEVRGGFRRCVASYSPRLADIWSLGVTFMNLVCNVLPWEKASSTDHNFVCFVDLDADYLLHYYPISRQFNDLLKRIFTIDARERISICQIKDAIQRIETFGGGIENGINLEVNPEDIYGNVHGNWDIENPLDMHIARQRGKLEVRNGPVVLSDNIERSYSESTCASSDIGPLLDDTCDNKCDVVSRPPTPEPAQRRRHRVLTPVPPSIYNFNDINEGSGESSDSELNASPDSDEIAEEGDASLSSGEESEGPITPEQFAADDTAVVVSTTEGIANIGLEEVPDLSENGIHLGGPSVLATNAVAAKDGVKKDKGKAPELGPPPLPPRSNLRKVLDKKDIPLPLFVKNPLAKTREFFKQPTKRRKNPVGAQVLDPPAYIPHYKTATLKPSTRGLDMEQIEEYYRRYILHLEPNLAISMEPRLDVTVPGERTPRNRAF